MTNLIANPSYFIFNTPSGGVVYPFLGGAYIELAKISVSFNALMDQSNTRATGYALRDINELMIWLRGTFDSFPETTSSKEEVYNWLNQQDDFVLRDGITLDELRQYVRNSLKEDSIWP